jgi:hypothetical protein
MEDENEGGGGLPMALIGCPVALVLGIVAAVLVVSVVIAMGSSYVG